MINTVTAAALSLSRVNDLYTTGGQSFLRIIAIKQLFVALVTWHDDDSDVNVCESVASFLCLIILLELGRKIKVVIRTADHPVDTAWVFENGVVKKCHSLNGYVRANCRPNYELHRTVLNTLHMMNQIHISSTCGIMNRISRLTSRYK